MEQARRLSPPVEEPAETGTEEARILPDGYRRVSPVQPYIIPPNSRRRRLKRVLLITAIAVGVIMLFWELLVFMSVNFVLYKMPKFS